MFTSAIQALVVTAGLLPGMPPIYALPRELPPRVMPLPLPLPLPIPQPSPPGCMSAADARALAQAGQVVPLSTVLGQIRQSANGRIVSPLLLCDLGGRLVYFLDVLVGGRVVRLQVDGRTGRVGP
jgi:hypothetical protein